MKPNRSSRGRKLLSVIILLLGGILVCLFLGILISVPSRTAELIGPPDPDLPLNKLYPQSLLLLLSQEQLSVPIQPLSNDFSFTIGSGESFGYLGPG